MDENKIIDAYQAGHITLEEGRALVAKIKGNLIPENQTPQEAEAIKSKKPIEMAQSPKKEQSSDIAKGLTAILSPASAPDILMGKNPEDAILGLLSGGIKGAAELTPAGFLYNNLPKKAQDYMIPDSLEAGFKAIERDAPISSAIGEMTAQAPAYSAAGGALEDLPLLGKLFKMAPEEGAGAIKNYLTNLAKTPGKGALENLLVQQGIDPDIERAGSDASIGAGVSTGAKGLAGIFKGTSGALNIARKVKEGISNTAENALMKGDRNIARNEYIQNVDKANADYDAAKTAYQAQKEGIQGRIQDTKDFRKQAIKDAGSNITKTLGATDPLTAGQATREAVSNAKNINSTEYKSVFDPMLEQHAQKTVDAAPLRQQILNTFLKDADLASDPNFSISNINELESLVKNNILEPQKLQSYKRLLNYARSLEGANPTIGQLNAMRSGLSELSKGNGLFGPAAQSAKDLLEQSVLEASGNNPGIKDAISKYAQRASNIKGVKGKSPGLNNLINRQDIQSSVGKFSPELVQNTMRANPEQIPVIKQNISTDLSSVADKPGQFSKKLDKYNREVLKNLFGEEQYQKLIDHEAFLNSSLPKVDLPTAPERANVPRMRQPETPQWFKTADKITDLGTTVPLIAGEKAAAGAASLMDLLANPAVGANSVNNMTGINLGDILNRKDSFNPDEYYSPGNPQENMQANNLIFKNPKIKNESLEANLVMLAALSDILSKSGLNDLVPVTSTKRTPEENASLPGASPTSNHLYGMAADLGINNITPEQVDLLINKAIESKLFKGGLHKKGTAQHVHLDFLGQ